MYTRTCEAMRDKTSSIERVCTREERSMAGRASLETGL